MRCEINFTIDLSFRGPVVDSESRFTGNSWSRLRKIVRHRAKSICAYCGKKDPDGHVDHIVPIARGGTDELSNLAWACSSCNVRKGAKTAEEFLSGVTVRMREYDRGLPPELSGLPVAFPVFAELVRGVLAGTLSWSMGAMMSIGISNWATRQLQKWLRDKNWIVPNGDPHNGYVTTEAGFEAFKSLLFVADGQRDADETYQLMLQDEDVQEQTDLPDDTPEAIAPDLDVPMMVQAIVEYQKEGRVSVSLLQRRLGIGYSRAARVVEKLQDAGVVLLSNRTMWLDITKANEFLSAHQQEAGFDEQTE